MNAGDVKILRNAGARVTDDVLRTWSSQLTCSASIGCWSCPHTNCKMASATEAEIHDALAGGVGLRHAQPGHRSRRGSVGHASVGPGADPALPTSPQSGGGGAIYDVTTGQLHPVDA